MNPAGSFEKGIRPSDTFANTPFPPTQGADPSAAEAEGILKKMEKVVNLTEQQLDLLTQNKARIDELHLGGKLLASYYHSSNRLHSLDGLSRILSTCCQYANTSSQ